MDFDNTPAPAMAHALTGLGLNLLCRDVRRETAFLIAVFGMTAHQAGRDFALMRTGSQLFQLHSDASFAAHPLAALLPETPPRGAGIELRLYDIDPDVACAAAACLADAMILQPATDKPGHALREAVILSPEGYAWVPSRRIQPSD